MDMTIRPRRLRGNEILRKMVRETRVDASSLIYPIFVKEGTGIREEIPTMPGQYRYSVDRMGEKLQSLLDAGVKSVMFFGIPDHKDEVGSGAYAKDGIVQKALRQAKRDFPGMYLITDVCMCEYTSHGHCGVLCGDGYVETPPPYRSADIPPAGRGCHPARAGRAHQLENASRWMGTVDNDRTLELLAKTAVSHAQAGADMVAPSDMMDGRVAAIRAALDEAGYLNVPIMSYAVKYASAFYGPFRDAAGSAPAFGDRKSYQMDYHNSREGIKEALLDVEEGADIIMVKPAMSYLDMVAKIKEVTDVPVASYSVSGEYAMIKAGAQLGYIDEEKIICETAISAFRAGCDIYLTYFAEEIAKYIREGKIG
ncbi:MAG: porphobilinogen synthase [Clostridiales bacterium]|nr:porphobilinogen synthase [Clostridiales bacterium]